ncbi:uncharacterized protein LOC135223016 [Macrobrachium nipponense]|uniref:uncharacterized protein LOC135223016 n=1 Tax=Macrobrachium nipponense TaxID=159736 RepID=UPI0030C86056
MDVGAIGSESDGGVFAQSRLSELLATQQANLPQPEALSRATNRSPLHYFLVGDDAFPLRNYLMKPYPRWCLTKEERIYNYRISRARRTVENVNAFGILANRFRVFHMAICLRPDRAEAVVMAACVLHNRIIRCNSSRTQGDQEAPVTHELIPGSWRNDPPLGDTFASMTGNTATRIAKEQRNILKDYFASPEGSVHGKRT